MHRYLLVFIVVALSSCASFHPNEQPLIAVTFNEPVQATFQGRGAGAGMALMSSMGPVGIAVGLAIDEGIAKDIRAAMVQEGGESRAYLQSRIRAYLSQEGYRACFDACPEQALSVHVKRFGFKEVDATTEAISAEWLIDVVEPSGNRFTVHYPEGVEQPKVDSYPLPDLKKEGAFGLALLDKSLQQVLGVMLKLKKAS